MVLRGIKHGDDVRVFAQLHHLARLSEEPLAGGGAEGAAAEDAARDRAVGPGVVGLVDALAGALADLADQLVAADRHRRLATQAGHEFCDLHDVEGLAEVFIRTGRHHALAIFLRGECRHDRDRRGAQPLVLARGARHRQPVHAGHHHVHDREVEVGLLQRLKRAGPVLRVADSFV